MAAGTINATTMTEEFGQPAPQTLDVFFFYFEISKIVIRMSQ